MGRLSDILIRAGLIDKNKLAELEKWGAPISTEEDTEPDVLFPEEVVRGIEDALQDQGMVVVRETDLEAIPCYLKSMTPAVLHVVIGEQQEDFEVHVGQDGRGQFMLPWRSDSITDVLTNGETHLLLGSKKVYFRDARELFYGDTKTFVICTPVGDGNVVEGEEGS